MSRGVCQVPEHYSAGPDICWPLRGLELGVFAFIHPEGVHISCGSFAKFILFQTIPGPLTGNILFELQPASKVDEGFVNTNVLVWDIHFSKLKVLGLEAIYCSAKRFVWSMIYCSKSCEKNK